MYLLFVRKNIKPSEYHNAGFGEKLIMKKFLNYEINLEYEQAKKRERGM